MLISSESSSSAPIMLSEPASTVAYSGQRENRGQMSTRLSLGLGGQVVLRRSGEGLKGFQQGSDRIFSVP